MLLIRGGHIKPITSPDIENGEILISDDGKIAAIGQHLDIDPDTPVYDASDAFITPGLVDAHTHLGMKEQAIRWEGDDVNESVDPITPQIRGTDGINPRDEVFRLALTGGVTSVHVGPGSANVMGGTFAAIKLNGSLNVDKLILKAPTAMKIAFGENVKFCYGQNGKSPKTRMGIVALLRETLTKAQRYAAEVDAAERDPSQKRPFDFKLEALLPVIRGEIPLKAHAHRADDILSALRVAKEFGLDITLDHVTEGHLIVDELVEAGKPVLIGPTFGGKGKFELKEKCFETAGILERAGLQVSLITDAGVIPLHHLPLCAGLAVGAGMTEEGAWRAITINPARVIGIADRVGSLEVGKDADIAVFPDNPLRIIQARARQVFVNGKPQLSN